MAASQIEVKYYKVTAMPAPPYFPNSFYLLASPTDPRNCDMFLSTNDGTGVKRVSNTGMINDLVQDAIAGLAPVITGGGDTGGGSTGTITITIDSQPTFGHDQNVVSSDGLFQALSKKVDTIPNKGLSTYDFDDTARTNITNAQSTASGAQSTASSALSAAGTANTNASGAQTAANSAQSTANAANSAIGTHISNTSNPHGVTKAQVGLPNVPNVDATVAANIQTDNNHLFSTATEKGTWTAKQDALVSGTNMKTLNGQPLLGAGDLIMGRISKTLTNTAAQVGILLSSFSEYIIVINTGTINISLGTTPGGTDIVNNYTCAAPWTIIEVPYFFAANSTVYATGLNSSSIVKILTQVI